MEKKSIVYVAVIYLLWSLVLSWPLALNLGGFLQPEGFLDISPSETLNFIGGMYLRGWLFMNGQGFFIPPYTMAQVYHVIGAASVMVFGLDIVVFHNYYGAVTWGT